MIIGSLNRRGVLLGAGAAAMAARAGLAQTPTFRMARGYAPGPFGQIHYGDGVTGKPLLLIHQNSMSWRQFETVFPLFAAAGFRPIAFDLPGYGNSDPPAKPATIADWATSVPALLDHLKIAQIDVVGHHTGGTVATEAALRYPDRVKNVIIHGAYLATPEERAGYLNRPGNEIEYKADGSHLSNLFVSRAKAFGPDFDPKLLTRYVIERLTATGPQGAAVNAVFTHDHGEAISRLKHRTLIITNTGDQIYEMTLRVKKVRPDIPFVELPGGGIDYTDQNPTLWVKTITDFLAG